jgi:tetratricopeptide (TPR) repeat protein
MKIVAAILFTVGMMWNSAAASPGASEEKIPVTTASQEAKKEFLLGQELSDNLQATKSIEHFDKAIALDPSFASAFLNRANNSFTTKEFFDNLKEAMNHKGSVSEGERLLILAADAGANANFQIQKECLEKAVALYPNDERAHFTLGAYYFGQQEYKEAIDQYEKSIHLSDRFAPAYNILGYAYRQIENYHEAEKVFKKYTELIPNDANPYDSYAELLLKIGRFDESITNYKKALALDSTFTSSEVGLCMNYLYQGNKENAAWTVRQLFAMARNPGERRQAFFIKAVVDIDEGNMESGLKDFDDEYVVGKEINDAAGMSGDFAAKANILLEMGRYDEALKTFDASVDIIEHSDLSANMKKNVLVIAHFNRAQVAVARGDLATAREETEEYWQGVKKKNNSNQIRFTHELNGLIALAEKKYDKATAELLQANQQDPYNIYRIALAFEGKGDLARAEEFYKKAAEFYGLPALNYAFIRAKAAAKGAGH